MTRRDLTAALMLGVVAAAGVYALTRIRWDVPPLAWLFLAGVLVGHTLGRSKQRRADTFRFWKSRAR